VKDFKVRYYFLTTALSLILMAFARDLSAQQQPEHQRRIIQLSGVTIDTVTGPVPGVHVYVPKAGRGVTTNGVGFFSMPVLIGDSIVVSSIGYQRQHFIVPASAPEHLTIVVPLVQDTIYLKTITVLSFPTEEVFKEAVLALNLPTDRSIDEKNLNSELLALMLKTTPMNGPQNQQYYLNQWAANQNARFMPVTNPFFNPFNWVKFFNGLKKSKK
jgi:hypothetical protein